MIQFLTKWESNLKSPISSGARTNITRAQTNPLERCTCDFGSSDSGWTWTRAVEFWVFAFASHSSLSSGDTWWVLLPPRPVSSRGHLEAARYVSWSEYQWCCSLDKVTPKVTSCALCRLSQEKSVYLVQRTKEDENLSQGKQEPSTREFHNNGEKSSVEFHEAA